MTEKTQADGTDHNPAQEHGEFEHRHDDQIETHDHGDDARSHEMGSDGTAHRHGQAPEHSHDRLGIFPNRQGE